LFLKTISLHSTPTSLVKQSMTAKMHRSSLGQGASRQSPDAPEAKPLKIEKMRLYALALYA
jgi:hypothetical protein